MADNQSNISNNINYSRVGLNTDSVEDQVEPGYVTDALNALIGSFDGKQITYQNEEGSIFCFNPPTDYKVIGVKNITQLNEVLYVLVNPTTGNSIVGYTINNECIFNILLDDRISGSDLMGFDISHPILKFEVKTTNCSTQIYFTDAFNDRRFIDLNNLPWKDILIGGIVTPLIGQIDINKMLVQPVFTIPTLTATSVEIGGNIIEGCYQFAMQYASALSDGLTGFYSVTNPVRIFLDHTISSNFNEVTNKSIAIDIKGLDTTGLYSYFNLAVIKTINGALAGVDLVGTFSIQGSNFQHTYSGLEQSHSNIKLDITDIMEKYEYYDTAGTLTQVDNKLAWADLTKEEDNSYQKIWNDVTVHWGTSSVPTGQNVGYHDGSVCANYEGYHRDEVYALEGVLLLDNGRELARGHIPGRAAISTDLVIVGGNEDTKAVDVAICPITPLPRWKVYNTGSIIGSLPGSPDPCNGIQPYQYGFMSYWESTETYPNKPEVWGILANQPIRHHKFPDCSVTHIHDQNPFTPGTDQYNNYQHTIYPIGFKIDIMSLWNAIQVSTDLTPDEKRKIVGFKIMRSDRGANRSIVAKGILYNCGQYTKDGSTYYYANYPFNDVRPDPFISSIPVNNKSGSNSESLLNNFQQSRFTFHSPDTHFYQPSGLEQSLLYLETAEYGSCKSHFVPVEKNAGEKLKTVKDLEICLAAGILSMVGVQASFATTAGVTSGITTSVTPSVNPQNFFPSFNTMMDIIDKLIPYTNYGWQYNGVGYYGNYLPIPASGNKIRFINSAGYLVSGLNGTFGDTTGPANAFNNTSRESSVYISTNDILPYTHQQGAPQDTSRTNASLAGLCGLSTPFFRNVSSYYASIKRELPGQYGEIFSYLPVDTGTYSTFFDINNNQITDLPIIYGGDIFINEFCFKIKHAFFLKDIVGLPDGTDIDYNQDVVSNTNTGNVGYPIWYYSTENNVSSINNSAINGAVTNFINTLSTPAGIILTVLTGGLLAIIQALILIVTLINQGLLISLGIKITNLDCPPNLSNDDGLYERGEAYLYAYGIVRYFVESEVNVDMRQGYNNFEGNFYPNVSSDIPDNWLQQINVPIANDNTYIYNKTYSKQNKEHFFELLRPDWEPNQTCYINFNNRAIWSDTSDLEETKNNWLIYRPNNLHDFPKSYGKLIAMDTLENKSVLIRFENRSQIYNAMATIATSQLTAALGTGDLFSGVPIDLSSSDSGDYGTQNKFILNTPQGHIFVDAKRGEVLLLRGNTIEDLSGVKYLNSKWFAKNLEFQILKSIPNVDIDNNYNSIGLHGVYDDFYHRLILTKIDYQPLVDGIQWDGENFYISNGTSSITSYTSVAGTRTCCPDGFSAYDSIYLPCRNNVPGSSIYCSDASLIDSYCYTDYIDCPSTESKNSSTIENKLIVNLDDPNYFCNKSWTISFSFLTNTWVSWHSYQPNYYIEYEKYFQAALNGDNPTIWSHNSTFSLFNNFFGTIYPYIIEHPFVYKFADEILQNVKEYCTVLKYTDYNQSVEPKETIYFNKAILYTGQQCSGLRNLIVKSNNDLSQLRKYPKYNVDSIDILVTKSDHFYNYNQFWDIVVNPDNNIWSNVCGTQFSNKNLNDSNMNYTVKSFKKYQLRAKDCKVRHILDNRNDIKIISKFILTENEKSYR